MKYTKMLGPLAVAATALLAFAGTASAVVLTSPAGTTYTGEIVGTSTNIKLHGSFVTVECSHSVFKMKVETHGGTEAGGNVSSLTFTGCNYPKTVTKGGFKGFRIGSVIVIGSEWHMHTSVGTCTFTTNNTTVGALTESSTTKGRAVIDINSAKIPRTGGNFLCGSSGTMTGSYTITTPSTLYVD